MAGHQAGSGEQPVPLPQHERDPLREQHLQMRPLVEPVRREREHDPGEERGRRTRPRLPQHPGGGEAGEHERSAEEEVVGRDAVVPDLAKERGDGGGPEQVLGEGHRSGGREEEVRVPEAVEPLGDLFGAPFEEVEVEDRIAEVGGQRRPRKRRPQLRAAATVRLRTGGARRPWVASRLEPIAAASNQPPGSQRTYRRRRDRSDAITAAVRETASTSGPDRHGRPPQPGWARSRSPRARHPRARPRSASGSWPGPPRSATPRTPWSDGPISSWSARSGAKRWPGSVSATRPSGWSSRSAFWFRPVRPLCSRERSGRATSSAPIACCATRCGCRRHRRAHDR